MMNPEEKIDQLISNFFSAFDNVNNKIPKPGAIIDCFAERSIITHYANGQCAIYSVLDFTEPRIELLTNGSLLNFHEWEENSTTKIFDGIATRISHYKKSGHLNGANYEGSGTKCFQLANTQAGWRIVALSWTDDNV
jgi:hypothetical protein